MKILFDTNIILDVWLKRQPFFDASVQMFTNVETGRVTGYLCATTVTTLFYIARKEIGIQSTFQAIKKLLDMFDIAPVNRSVLRSATDGSFSDFEDGVLYESARLVGADFIVTRNMSDFEKAEIPAYSPDNLNALIDLRDAEEVDTEGV